jgi:hypothetical protein
MTRQPARKAGRMLRNPRFQVGVVLGSFMERESMREGRRRFKVCQAPPGLEEITY